MTRDQIIELLKNYQAYRQAISNYENHQPYPMAAIANYDPMPSGSGAPELFFANQGRMASMGFVSELDTLDYRRYKRTVRAIDDTVENVLSDNERFVIKNKWLNQNRMDLCKIADYKDKDESTVRRWHREALKKLEITISLARVEKIELPDILLKMHG